DWFPKHVLPLAEFFNDPRFVCTEATDHDPPRGLILYDVRSRNRPREKRPATEFEVVAFEPAQNEFRPMAEAQLPKVIPFYAPGSSNYVILAPQEFFKSDYVKQKAAKEWDRLRVKLPFFMDRWNQMVAAKYISWMIFGASVAAYAGVVVVG